MDNKRFLDTKAVAFENGKIVPLWLCGYKNDEYFGSSYLFQDEKSSQVLDATWDIKKKELVPVFLVDKEIPPIFSIGEKVVYEKGYDHSSGTGIKLACIGNIKGIRKERDTIYYEKTNENSVRVEKVVAENELPEGTKIIGFITYKYYYTFHNDEKEYNEFYVFKIV